MGQGLRGLETACIRDYGAHVPAAYRRNSAGRLPRRRAVRHAVRPAPRSGSFPRIPHTPSACKPQHMHDIEN